MTLELLKDWPVGEPVPAISIRQPWATAVVLLGKDVENRDHWLYKYRGPILIQASATKFYLEDVEEMLAIARKEGWPEEHLKNFDANTGLEGIYAQGVIIGVVRLAGVFGVDDKIADDHPIAGSPWGQEESPYWLHFADVEPCIPFEHKGRVGLFKVPYEIAMKLEQLPPDDEVEEPSPSTP